jgi:23S rRNA (adenine2503-C2)-methyltransferase
MKFLELVSDERGLNIGMRHISLSTSGIVPRIYDLLDRRLQLTLSVSLHAPNDEIRSKIMPVNTRWNVSELLDACRKYADVTSRRISFEYAMMQGVNDSVECAAELAAKLKGILCHVNLIPANEVPEKGHKRSNDVDIEKFKSILEKAGHTVTIRRTLGSDINASCGQLRREKIKEDNLKK